MKIIRWSVCGAVVAVCVIGGLASLQAFLTGTTADYIARLDASPLPILALVLTAACIALALIPDRTSTEGTEAES